MTAHAELSLADTEAALGDGVVAFEDHQRDLITVSGPDAATYLQGQLSQDVEALAVGSSARSFLLNPQGKVDAWCRVTRTAADTFVIDVDHGHGTAALARLQRFLLRTDATIDLVTTHWVAVRGPRSSEVEEAHPGSVPPARLVVAVDWRGMPGVDLFDPMHRPRVDGVVVPLGDHRALDAWRIRLGIPGLGTELADDTIPNETGVIDESVSFTKGCYVGQELVARVDSRGNNTPRRLVGVRLERPDGLAAGASLTRDGVAVAEITSVAPLADGSAVALAYLKRGNELGDCVAVGATGESCAATLVDVPF